MSQPVASMPTVLEAAYSNAMRSPLVVSYLDSLYTPQYQPATLVISENQVPAAVKSLEEDIKHIQEHIKLANQQRQCLKAGRDSLKIKMAEVQGTAFRMCNQHQVPVTDERVTTLFERYRFLEELKEKVIPLKLKEGADAIKKMKATMRKLEDYVVASIVAERGPSFREAYPMLPTPEQSIEQWVTFAENPGCLEASEGSARLRDEPRSKQELFDHLRKLVAQVEAQPMTMLGKENDSALSLDHPDIPGLDYLTNELTFGYPGLGNRFPSYLSPFSMPCLTEFSHLISPPPPLPMLSSSNYPLRHPRPSSRHRYHSVNSTQASSSSTPLLPSAASFPPFPSPYFAPMTGASVTSPPTSDTSGKTVKVSKSKGKNKLYSVLLGPAPWKVKDHQAVADILRQHRKIHDTSCPRHHGIRDDPDDASYVLIEFGSYEKATRFVESWSNYRDHDHYHDINAKSLNT